MATMAVDCNTRKYHSLGSRQNHSSSCNGDQDNLYEDIDRCVMLNCLERNEGSLLDEVEDRSFM